MPELIMAAAPLMATVAIGYWAMWCAAEADRLRHTRRGWRT